MAETFHGTWLVDVVGKDAWFSQRYVINGSDRVDGAYPAAVGSPRLQVSGAEWTLTLEWNDNASSGWQPSRVIRRSVDFGVDDGLVVVLGADDNWVAVADNDFDDVLVRCQNIDPHLIPWHPHRRTVDFRLPRRKGDDGQTPDPCGCPPKDQPPRLETGPRGSVGGPGLATHLIR